MKISFLVDQTLSNKEDIAASIEMAIKDHYDYEIISPTELMTATGDYVMFTDVTYNPHGLRLCMDWIAEHPGIDIYYPDVWTSDHRGITESYNGGLRISNTLLPGIIIDVNLAKQVEWDDCFEAYWIQVCGKTLSTTKVGTKLPIALVLNHRFTQRLKTTYNTLEKQMMLLAKLRNIKEVNGRTYSILEKYIDQIIPRTMSLLLHGSFKNNPTAYKRLAQKIVGDI